MGCLGAFFRARMSPSESDPSFSYFWDGGEQKEEEVKVGEEGDG